jgi:outer membrane protein TolC
MNLFYDNHYSWVLRVTLILAVAIAPGLLMGQQRLSLDDAVQEGLVKNYQLLVAKNETEMSSQNITYGNAGFLPSVSAYGALDKSYLDAQVKVISGSELDNKTAEARVTAAGIKAEWVLFDGAGMFVEYEKLKSLWKISNLETRITMEQVVYDIILAYSDIIRQKELFAACKQRLESSKLRYSIAHKKLDSGLGSEQEWLQSHVALQADSTALITQTAELSKSKISLNRLLASDIQRDFITDDSICLIQIPEPEQLRASSLELNNLLKINTEQVMYSKLEEKSLKSEQYPRLLLTGSYNYFENNTEAAFIKYNRYLGPQVGINVGIKLFDGLKLKRSLQNARINVQNKELLLQDVQLYVSALIGETYLDYRSLMQTIGLGKERLRLAQKNLDIAIKAWQVGVISSVQLRVAQDDLFLASSDLVNAYYQVKVKETELLSISGVLIK